MTAEEREWLIRLVNDPPPGSKLAAAKEYGIDLTLLIRRLDMTPTERVKELGDAQSFIEALELATRLATHQDTSDRNSHPTGTWSRLISTVQDSGVSFVIIGGAVAASHGLVHMLTHLQLCYERGGDNIQRLVNALAPYHPRLRGAPSELPFRFDVPTASLGLNFTLNTDLGDLDLLGEVRGIGFYADLLDRSKTIDLFGRPCFVLSLEGLITSKRSAGRARDLAVLPELEALRELEILRSGRTATSKTADSSQGRSGREGDQNDQRQ